MTLLVGGQEEANLVSHTPLAPALAARYFLERGWPPLPIAPGKKAPLIPWQRFRYEKPQPNEVEGWFRLWPEANVGIVTGLGSGLAVLDLDGLEACERAKDLGLPDAPKVLTARGVHIYCQSQEQLSTRVLMRGVEIRAEGAYVVAPPSIHESGVRYTWLVPPDHPLPPLPTWAVHRPSDRVQGWVLRALQGVEEGHRNSTCARLAGHLLAKGLGPTEVEAILLMWNQANHPPLAEPELRRTIASITTRGRRQRTEALPFTERTMLEFLTGPGRECSHGVRSTYQAICILESKRGLARGTILCVSYKELAACGGVSPQHARKVLSRLASLGLIEFRAAGRGGGLRGQAATIRRLSLPNEIREGESNQLGT